MEVGRAPGVRVMPAYPFCVVGNPDKIRQELSQNGWRAICSGDGCNDGIHVNEEACKIDDQTHGTNSGDRCLGLRLMSIEDIHAILGLGDHILEALLLDHAIVLLK